MKFTYKSFFILFLFVNLIIAQKTSTGLIPINDLGNGIYKNYMGGLYPNGLNTRPLKHDSLGLTFSSDIKPLNSSGNVDLQNGKFVFLSIGMSNTTQEFSYFKSIADTFKEKNPRLVIVDGAQGGQTAAIISNPSANFWNVIEQRLQNSGVTTKQVVACWLKEADANPTQPFPNHVITLTNELVLIARILKQKYPNCKVVYCSSRTYGGYAKTSLNPEPFAYESGFAVKWLIERQINGDPELKCDGTNPIAPWLSWGPYLWADGIIPRSDGLTWAQSDFRSDDGTHPSASGQKKVAEMLLNFLTSDQTAKKWFLINPPTNVEIYHNTLLETFKLFQNYPNPFNPTTTISYQLPKKSFVTIKVFDILGKEVATLVNENKPAGYHNVVFDETRSERGRGITSGIYIYTISANGIVQTKKMLLVK